MSGETKERIKSGFTGGLIGALLGLLGILYYEAQSEGKYKSEVDNLKAWQENHVVEAQKDHDAIISLRSDIGYIKDWVEEQRKKHK